MPSIISRSSWKARASNGTLYDVPWSKRTGFVVHHSGADDDQTVKAIQNYHMTSDQLSKGGWKDIGYNFLIDKYGKIYEGVGWEKSGAHARGYNTSTIGVCIIGNYSNRMPTLTALKSLEWLYAEANKHKGSKLRLYGHGQLGNTSCPGDRFLRELRGGIIKVTSPSKPSKPSEPSNQGWTDSLMANLQTLKRNSEGVAVKRVQALLNVAGASPKLKEDGLFGPRTENETQEFQVKNNTKNSVKNGKGDGIVGRYTWTDLLGV